MTARRTFVAVLSIMLIAMQFSVWAAFGDVDNSGEVDAVDVQLVINAALNIQVDPAFTVDLDDDGDVNAVDVQLVINAVLGIGPIEPPGAAFSAQPQSGNAPLAVTFTDESIDGSTPIESREWTFGDGETSSKVNPQYTYEEPGVYSVSLTVTTEDATDTETRIDYILAKGILPQQGAPGTKVNIVGDDFSAVDQMDISIFFGDVEMPPAAASDLVLTTSAPIMDAGIVTVRVEILQQVVVDGLSFEILAPPALTAPPGTVAANAQNDLGEIRSIVGTLTDLFGDTLSAKQAGQFSETVDLIDLQMAAIDGLLDNAPEEDKQKVDELLISSGLADELAGIRVEAKRRMKKCAELDAMELELWLKSGCPAKAWTIPARYRFVGDWMAARLHHAMEYANVALLGLNAFAAAGGGGMMSAGLAVVDVFAAFLNMVYGIIEALPMQLENERITGQVGLNNIVATNSFGNVLFEGTFKPESTLDKFLFGLFFPKFADKLGLSSIITAPLTHWGGELVAYANQGVVIKPIPPEVGVPIYTYDFVGDPVTVPNPPSFNGGGLATLAVDESRVYTGDEAGGPLDMRVLQKVFEFKGSFWDPSDRPRVEHYLVRAAASFSVENGAEIELDDDGGEGEGETSRPISGTVTNADGSPAADTTVTITVTTGRGDGSSVQGSDSVTTTTDSSGHFSTEVPLFVGENIIEVSVTVDDVTTTVDVEIVNRVLPATYCVVTNVNDNSLSLIDPDMNNEFLRFTIDSVIDGPQDALFLPNGETLIVVNKPSGGAAFLSVLQISDLENVVEIGSPLQLGEGWATSLSLTPDSDTLVIPYRDYSNDVYAVHIVDVRQPNALRLADTVPIPPFDSSNDYSPRQITTGVAADGRTVALVTTGFYQDDGPSHVAVLDITNPYNVSLLSTVSVTSRSGSIRVVPGRPLAVVAGISYYDVATTSIESVFDIIDFSDPEHVAVRDTLTWNAAWIAGLAVTPDGNTALVANAGNPHFDVRNTMLFIDISNPGDVYEMTSVPFQGQGSPRIAVSPEGDTAVVTSHLANMAVVFDLPETGPPVANDPIMTGLYPWGVAFRP